jgi:protein-S-isoprenylcysteine O-methyltransferase Ste14
MLHNARGNPEVSRYHPAGRLMESALKKVMLITASALTALTFFLPLIAELFPVLTDYLLPLGQGLSDRLRPAGMLLLVFGNLVSTAAACTLKKQVTFHGFGETRSLYTGGIYRFLRNPISVGLAAVYAGFFFYLPSVVMGLGFLIVMINCSFRIRMEEIYLERTFGERYQRYKQTTGKYFPRIYRS